MLPESPSDGPSLEVGGGRGLRVAITVGGVLLAIAVVAVAAFVLVGRDDDDEPDQVGQTSSSSTPPEAPASGSTLDLPTIDPSDFPSDLPTERLPSPLPSNPIPPGEVRTGLPSGIPTELPDFPTDPADLESWFSDYLKQVNPR